MSESGRSTAGEYLLTRHVHARLKIGYLIDDAARRAGITNPYAISPVVRAELILEEVLLTTKATADLNLLPGEISAVPCQALDSGDSLAV
ncbi:hypothetical protein AB0F16_19060 [Streptomyces tanashiensis]|uniref:hypothetical protein n=1 Tax=Streptomyces tanashiensis TaxID=67367 RepID=UPI0033D57F36